MPCHAGGPGAGLLPICARFAVPPPAGGGHLFTGSPPELPSFRGPDEAFL